MPNLAPLIVIDLQTNMFDGRVEPPIHDAPGIAERTCSLIDWARREGRKVAFVRHDGPAGDPLAPGEPGWPVWPELGQAKDEPTFSKTVRNAFSNAELGAWVAGQGVGEVVLAGAQTDFCIAGTVEGALAEGFGVTVVSDAHSTLDTEGETATEIVARYNADFTDAGVTLVTTKALTGD
ncbi:isochorismatase family protein [Mesorhizobium sp. M0058]|uniref:isochorismatase family protein n=1 Tax=Mesorhizobium sp. M0058 TaxID=2956865 RepID=UPI00333A27A6